MYLGMVYFMGTSEDSHQSRHLYQVDDQGYRNMKCITCDLPVSSQK